jgi:hypothetical protein
MFTFHFRTFRKVSEFLLLKFSGFVEHLFPFAFNYFRFLEKQKNTRRKEEMFNELVVVCEQTLQVQFQIIQSSIHCVFHKVQIY